MKTFHVTVKYIWVTVVLGILLGGTVGVAALSELSETAGNLVADDGRSHCILDLACIDIVGQRVIYILDVVGDPLPDGQPGFQRQRDLLLIRYEENGKKTESLITKIDRPSMLPQSPMRIVPVDSGAAHIFVSLFDGGSELYRVQADGRVVRIGVFGHLSVSDVVGSDRGATLATANGSGKDAIIDRIDIASGRVSSSRFKHNGTTQLYTSVVPDSEAGQVVAAGFVITSTDPMQPGVKVVVARIDADGKKLAEALFPADTAATLERVMLARVGRDTIAIVYAVGQKHLLKFLRATDLTPLASVELPYDWSMPSGAAITAGSREGIVWLVVPDRPRQVKDYILMCYDTTGKQLCSWRLLSDANVHTFITLAADADSLILGFSADPGDDARSPKWRAQVRRIPIASLRPDSP